MKRILFLGPKSPPVTGYSNIVSALAKYLNAQGHNVTYLSTVPTFLSQFFPSKRWKIFRLLYLFILVPITMILVPFHSVIYLNINGGLAQIFDLIIVGISRVFRKKIVLHHNSYSYINKKNRLSAMLFLMAGDNTYHIVNCRNMKNKITSIYSTIKNIEYVSNVAILAESNSHSEKETIAKQKDFSDKFMIGFMGYYNSEKGIDLFASVIKKITDANKVSVHGIAVGPVHDEVLMKKFLVEYNAIVDFKAPAYGIDRDNFFEEIDILLFPSKYTNEAEPLTIHHALEAGVPVISTDIGCLKDVMNYFESSTSLSIDEFVDDAVISIYKFVEKTIEERNIMKVNLKSEYEKYSIQNSNHLKQTIQNILE